MAVDLTQIQTLQAEVSALTDQLATTTDVSARAVIQAQIKALNVQLTTATNNAVAQSQSWTNLLAGLTGLSAISSGTVPNLSGLANIFKGFKL